MSNSGFDARAFYAALDLARTESGKSWKRVADEAKISASTLTRMGQGKRPDVDSLAKLASWANLDVDQFVKRAKAAKSSQGTLIQMSALLRADRNLNQKGAEALEAILKSAYSHLRDQQK
jgi:transcriptional regulator with XRE-family HTH domain